MYILDRAQFDHSLQKSGYPSIEALAKALRVHRNTIHYYLSGHPVFPKNFEKIIKALSLKPADILIQKTREESYFLKEITPFVDQMQKKFPQATLVLFGSRAQGRGHCYSDWDIGVYSVEDLPHPIFRKMLRERSDYFETKPVMGDLVNLNQADDDFLSEISRSWIFLGGKLSGWVALQEKINE